MRSLITGMGGFAGGHLAAALVERDEEVVGYTLALPPYPQLEPLAGQIELVEGDIIDADALTDVLLHFRPQVVFHLAAITHVGQAWTKKRATLEANVLGTATVLGAAAQVDPKPMVVLASSGQVYGASVCGDEPLSENCATLPTGPYGASKLCAEILALQAWYGEGLPCVILRTFNFTGPHQSPDFVCSDFARQVAWAEAGLRDAEIVVGNLDARRDFCDVRDIVEGYLLAAKRGQPGDVFNLASGRAVRIGDVLEQLLRLATVSITVSQDPERLRPAEIAVLRGDYSRARERLGWEPRIPFEETLASVLDFWRQRAEVEAASRQGG